MILAIDFDDTIHDPRNRKPGYKLGVPMLGALDALTKLHREGHKVIVFCVWADTVAGREAIAAWMNYFKFPAPLDITATKPPAADYFIDDRAIHFTNWEEVMDEITRRKVAG